MYFFGIGLILVKFNLLRFIRLQSYVFALAEDNTLDISCMIEVKGNF
jgi:hypothetical protein